MLGVADCIWNPASWSGLSLRRRQLQILVLILRITSFCYCTTGEIWRHTQPSLRLLQSDQLSRTIRRSQVNTSDMKKKQSHTCLQRFIQKTKFNWVILQIFEKGTKVHTMWSSLKKLFLEK